MKPDQPGLGLNWYLSKTVKTTFDVYDTRFSNLVPVSATQILRQDEKAFITPVPNLLLIGFSSRTPRESPRRVRTDDPKK